MARSFAANGSIDTGNTLIQIGITASYTAFCWFYPNNNTSLMSQLADDDAGDGGGGIEFIQINGTPATFWARCTNSSGTKVTVTGGAIINTAWNTQVSTYDGSNLTLYGNGTLIQSLAQTGTLKAASSNFIMGGRGSFTGFPWNGRIADVALWDVALTAAEITALNLGARPFTIRSTHLKGYWPLDGLVSPEPDLSGNAHNGTLVNATLVAGPPFMPFTPRWPQFNFPSPPPFTLMPQIVM